MSISVTINNKTFNIPIAGDDPGWGEEVTEWIVEASTVINGLLGPGDILETEFSIANNTSSPASVIGLLFNPALIRAAAINYSIYRRSNLNPSGKSEVGTMHAVYDNDAGAGDKWLFTLDGAGDSGVTFDITDVGQVTFTSTDIGAAGYIGTMHFAAVALLQI